MAVLCKVAKPVWEGCFALQQKMTAKERIISAAKQLFAERGFHRTSMADLSELAQVSVGAIYRAFPGKAAIIREIILVDTAETLGQLRAVIAQVRRNEASAPAVVEQMIFRWVSGHSDALEHEIVAEGHRNPEIASMIAEVCGQFRDLLRTLATLLQSGLDDDETEGIAELLLACLFGMGNRQFTHPRLTEPQTATAVARLILRGVQANAP